MNLFLTCIERFRFLLIALLMVLVPILIDMGIGVPSGPISKFRFFEYGVFLIVLFSIPLWCTRKHSFQFNLISITILLWMAYLVVRALFDPFREYALDMAFRTCSWLMFALLIADACATVHDFKRLLWITLMAQLAPLVMAVANLFHVCIYLNWILGTNQYWQNDLIGAERAIIWSSLGNPNFYGSYGILLLIWISTFFFLTKSVGSRILLGLYLFTLIITLLLTFTRGIWFSLFLTSMVIVLLWIMREWKLGIHLRQLNHHYGKVVGPALAAVLIGLSLIYSLETSQGPLHKVGERFQNAVQLRDTSLRSRPLLWFTSLRMWKKNPLWGQGIGQYQPQFLPTLYETAMETDASRIQRITRNMNTIRSDRAHNDYLQILAESGLVGYGLFLLCLLALLSTGIPLLLNKEETGPRSVMLAGSLAVLILITFQCMYDFPLLLPASALLLSLAIGGVLVLTRKPLPAKHTTPRFSRMGLLFSLLLIPCLFFSASLILRHFLSSHLVHKGFSHLNFIRSHLNNITFQERQTHFTLAEGYLQRALKWFPDDGVAQFELGRLYYACYPQRYRSRAISNLEHSRHTYCVPETFTILGALYLDQASYTSAKTMSDILLLIDPDRENVHFLAGEIAYRGRDFEKALHHLREELRLHPANTRALSLLGTLYKDQYHQLELAVALYEKLLAIEPGSADTHERLGDALVELQKYEQALHHYNLALEGMHALRITEKEKSIQLKISRLIDTMQPQERKPDEF